MDKKQLLDKLLPVLSWVGPIHWPVWPHVCKAAGVTSGLLKPLLVLNVFRRYNEL